MTAIDTAAGHIAEEVEDFAFGRGLMPDHPRVVEAVRTARVAWQNGATVGEACGIGYLAVVGRQVA